MHYEEQLQDPRKKRMDFCKTIRIQHLQHELNVISHYCKVHKRQQGTCIRNMSVPISSLSVSIVNKKLQSCGFETPLCL